MFLVLEGGEGSGKSSVLALLADALRAAGDNPLMTREPGGTPEGLAIRALLLAQDGPAWTPEAELLLITAARIQHVRRVIAPALAAGRIVLCDRFIGSTLAYQGAGRGIPAALISDLHTRLVSGPAPDLTLILDIDPREGLARSTRRLRDGAIDEGKFEALAMDFHDRVRAAFRAQAAAPGAALIDAARPLADVAAEAVALARAWLEQRKGKKDVLF